MKTLYVMRPLLNGPEFSDWATRSGFEVLLPTNDFHCTIAYSKAKVDWDRFTPHQNTIKISHGPRQVLPLGDKGAVVLKFRCPFLENRWRDFLNGGCSWDFPTYQPHVTITYAGSDVDLSKVRPFDRPLVFGPEVFDELDEDWKP